MTKRIAIIGIPFAALIILYLAGFMSLTEIDGHHFDIITVNSIFAGFLFSGLSLILGLGANKTVKTLERVNEMDWIYFSILGGIVCSLLSISSSLLITFFDIPIARIELTIKFLEIYFLAETIILFSVSVRKLMLIIKYSRRDIIKGLPDDTRIKGLMEKTK